VSRRGAEGNTAANAIGVGEGTGERRGCGSSRPQRFSPTAYKHLGKQVMTRRGTRVTMKVCSTRGRSPRPRGSRTRGEAREARAAQMRQITNEHAQQAVPADAHGPPDKQRATNV